MKFVSYRVDGKSSWGALSAGGKILDLSKLAPSLVAFLGAPDRDTEVTKLKASLTKDANLDLSKVQLEACIPNPPSMRDGYAFRQHVEAARRYRNLPMIPEYDEIPVYYFMNHQAVFGPGPVPIQPRHAEQLDLELEVAIVIGKKGKNIPAEKADEFIFGYTIMNDLSARKLQVQEMKLNMGPAKGKDFATSLGAWLVTKDELESYRVASPKGDRYKLEMTADVNDIPISKGNMMDMTWTFAQIIERASYGTYLYPGDVIGSGTVGTGCFYELNPAGITNQWLKPGDRVRLKVSGLGELENNFVEESEDLKT